MVNNKEKSMMKIVLPSDWFRYVRVVDYPHENELNQFAYLSILLINDNGQLFAWDHSVCSSEDTKSSKVNGLITAVSDMVKGVIEYCEDGKVSSKIDGPDYVHTFEQVTDNDWHETIKPNGVLLSEWIHHYLVS